MSAIAAFHQAIPGFLEHSGDRITLTLALRGDQPARVLVRTQPDNEETLTEMSAAENSDGWVWYRASITVEPSHFQTRYLFKLVWKDAQRWVSALGLEGGMPEMTHEFRFAHRHPVPGWISEQVFYQVFPDRFANGDESLTPATGQFDYLHGQCVLQKAWGERPDPSQGAVEFYGGDLPGIESRLDYLQHSLGVTALYLNPVFESRSNHKYDTIDYYNVDPHLGGNAALASLTQAVHERGMKVMLDAVINHTSVFNPWFQQAVAGDERQRRRYIFNDTDPTKPTYASWKGHDSLPVIDFANPDNVDLFINADDSVIRHWLREPYKIDGWRMDVIHMLGEGAGATNNAHYVRLLRAAIKEENSEAYLLGEHFFEASQWLQGDQEDGAMNYYGFGHPVRAFFAGLDIAYDPIQLNAAELAAWLAKARAAIPFAQQKAQLNQLDSHDTRRLITLLDGDEALYLAAMGMLMTYIGTPCLYYGDELALAGEDDPDCRRCFPWETENWPGGIFAGVQRWIGHRKAMSALQHGALIDLYAQDDVYVFARVLQDEQCLIAVNRGPFVTIHVEDRLLPLANDWQKVEGEGSLRVSSATLELDLPASATLMWRRC